MSRGASCFRAGVQWVSRDALDLLAITEIELGMPERGATFAGLAERLRAESGEPREPSGERLYRPAVEEAAGILGVERFEEELARGARLTLEDAVDAALDGARSGFGSGGGGGGI